MPYNEDCKDKTVYGCGLLVGFSDVLSALGCNTNEGIRTETCKMALAQDAQHGLRERFTRKELVCRSRPRRVSKAMLQMTPVVAGCFWFTECPSKIRLKASRERASRSWSL